MITAALEAALSAAGARTTSVAGRAVARHFGDPAAEYRAVRRAAAVAVRSDLVPFRMSGRDPVKMLHGLLTNDVAGAPAGKGVYGGLLTPKGRTVADLRAFHRDPSELLLLLPAEAVTGASEHLRKYVPPMFARWEDVSAALVVLGVYGPAAAEVVRGVLAVDPPVEEDSFIEPDVGGARLLVTATREAGGEPGFDLVVPAEVAAELWERLRAEAEQRGGGPVGHGTLETLRVEAGRPRYGAELSEEVIPTEAFEAIGWMPRAISFTKGCYTGQEVIVRIAHRGHVNRHLRGLLLGDSPAPPPSTALRHPETGKEIGRVTSSAVSPLMGGTVCLAYVRREVEPGSEVVVATDSEPRARVVGLPFAPARAAER